MGHDQIRSDQSRQLKGSMLHLYLRGVGEASWEHVLMNMGDGRAKTRCWQWLLLIV